jgi:phosphotransferase system  glucose/maltose/N-acetylglucosamine-specific IIC component
MKSASQKWMVACSIGVLLLVLCGYLGMKVDGGPPFLAFAAGTILMLCAFSEWLRCASLRQRLWISVLGGAGRGCLIGVSAWMVIMIIIGILEDTGDKFPLVVVFFIPFTLCVGAICGSVTRFVSHRFQKVRASVVE